jgi:hypothetical protein
VGELSKYIVGSSFAQRNDTSYAYDVCNRLAHVLKLYTSYPENNPINIDRNVLTKYHCNEFYIQVLNLQDFTRWTKDQKYFPIRDNKSVDWNALFYANQTNDNEFRRSFALVQKDIEYHKNNLLEVIFRSPITAFK